MDSLIFEKSEIDQLIQIQESTIRANFVQGSVILIVGCTVALVSVFGVASQVAILVALGALAISALSFFKINEISRSKEKIVLLKAYQNHTRIHLEPTLSVQNRSSEQELFSKIMEKGLLG